MNLLSSSFQVKPGEFGNRLIPAGCGSQRVEVNSKGSRILNRPWQWSQNWSVRLSIVLDRRAANFNEALVAVMRYCGAYTDNSLTFETITHLFDLYFLGYSVEGKNPLVSEPRDLFGRILIKVIHLIDTGRNDPIDQSEKSGIPGA